MKLCPCIYLAGILLFLLSSTLQAQITIGGYHVYYGHLHNHTSYSDGQGTPEQAYVSARTNGLDFFGLAEHSNSLSDAEWSNTQTVADANYVPGVFTTFRGFEWTTSAWGHVAVINTPSRILTSDASYDTFPELVTWLNTQSSSCFAFFNHPGEYNGSNTEFSHFDKTLVTDKIVGMEQWNKTDQFPVYYSGFDGTMINGYFSGDGVSFYDEAVQRGWRIAPEGSEDNHVATWGNMTEYKTAVLAPYNSREDLIAAFQARRFFTTADENTAMSFKINGSEMGSNVLPGTWTLQIQLSDGSSETFSKVELMKNGVVSATWTPGTTTVNISQQMSFLNGEYYYVRIYQAGSLTAFSAPIWITNGLVNVYPSVNLTSPASASAFAAPASVTISATATDSDGSITKTEFYQGATKLGEDTTAPYSYIWNNVAAGYYTITVKATDNLGAVSTSSPVKIAVYDPVLPNAVSSVIAAGTDDAEESSAGAVNTTSTDMELVNDSGTGAGDQTVGLRFTNLLIPKGATIKSAYIQFTCDETNNLNTCALTIKGEATGNSAPFSTTSGSISARTKTTASVSWSPADWTVADQASTAQQTPQITSVVQEIVNLASFTTTSPVTIIITGTGRRTAEAYEGVPASAAKLVVQFTLQQPVTPTFNPIGPLCQNSTPPSLPLASINGITGTWNPTVISTATPGTTIYTFTPNSGQNAVSTTLSVVVMAPVTPAFAKTGPLYQASTPPVLPLVSTNNISGTWNPATISTAVTGTFTYTFTPVAGQCASSATMQIEVLPKAFPVVSLTSPVSGSTLMAPATITLTATATDADGTISDVSFYQGSVLLGNDTSSPYSFVWQNVAQGTYDITAVAKDNDGQVSTSVAVSVKVNSALTFETRIAGSSDDAEEYNSGTMLLNSDDLELVYDTKTTGNQKVGLRFRGVTVARGATISGAYIRFTTDEIKSGTTTLLIQGQNADNANTFTTTKKDISNRAKTTASVSWSPAGWTAAGASGSAQQSPDLKAIVQEIVNRSAWASGNSIAFIISGTGTRTAVAFETSQTASALLHIDYVNPALKSASIGGTTPRPKPEILSFNGRLTCYPVPFSRVLNIQFEPGENEKVEKIEITDLTGALLKVLVTSENCISLSMMDLPAGIYLLGLCTDHNRYMKTVIKK